MKDWTEIRETLSWFEEQVRTAEDTAHALRVEWVTLNFDGLPHSDKTEAEAVLKRRMIEFLAEVPSWMLSGV